MRLSLSNLKQTLFEFRPIVAGFLFLAAVFLYGLYIYMVLEGWDFADSFYQVVITLSTVGFEEVHDLSDAAKLHTSVLILLGVGGFAYLLGSFTEAFVEGRVQMFWGKKKMQKRIEDLSGHYIICGYGRIGSVVAKELTMEGNETVVIESDPSAVQDIEKDRLFYIDEDATSDQTLLKAGLTKAKAIITTLDSDAKNLYVTLTARQLAPHITVVARAESESSIHKLEYAGADRVLTPHVLGGLRMAQLVMRPTVTNFLDMATRGTDLDLQMEELIISPASQLGFKNLIESELRPRFNLIIIAIKKKSGEMIYNPRAQEILNPNDTLVVVGRKTDLESVKAIL